ncbi:histidine kinase [Streptomyces sp. NPDC096013]|uniref:histidine kinase n=1 Tax=Streptomyces sp. NPDC096013 TaxID=3366069 RepID=UPI003804F373
MVAAGDASRRRIERDLHDGVQQRLVSLRLDLRTAQSMLGEQPEEQLRGGVRAGRGRRPGGDDRR